MPFDHEDPSVIGKTVLVGVTEFDATGAETRRQQWWGRILAFNARDGLKVDIANTGRAHAFPPFRDALRSAQPGTYELAASGDVVEDPDFVYTIRRDAPGN